MVGYDAVMRSYVAVGARAIEQMRRDGVLHRDQLLQRKADAFEIWDAAHTTERAAYAVWQRARATADTALDDYIASWTAVEEAAGR